jgi:hypothetical protein
MKLLVMVGAFLVGLITAAHAQAPGTTPKPGAPLENRRIAPSREVKAIGCLAKEDGRTLLRDAAIEITPWVSPKLPADIVGTPKPAETKTVFALLNTAGIDAYIGKRVEVAGIVAPATANLPPSPDTIAPARGVPGVRQPTAAGPQAVPRLDPPELDNKTVRLVTGACF